jgi:hypothetical protein
MRPLGCCSVPHAEVEGVGICSEVLRSGEKRERSDDHMMQREALRGAICGFIAT